MHPLNRNDVHHNRREFSPSERRVERSSFRRNDNYKGSWANNWHNPNRRVSSRGAAENRDESYEKNHSGTETREKHLSDTGNHEKVPGNRKKAPGNRVMSPSGANRKDSNAPRDTIENDDPNRPRGGSHSKKAAGKDVEVVDQDVEVPSIQSVDEPLVTPPPRKTAKVRFSSSGAAKKLYKRRGKPLSVKRRQVYRNGPLPDSARIWQSEAYLDSAVKEAQLLRSIVNERTSGEAGVGGGAGDGVLSSPQPTLLSKPPYGVGYMQLKPGFLNVPKEQRKQSSSRVVSKKNPGAVIVPDSIHNVDSADSS